jgi:hypothetical protein
MVDVVVVPATAVPGVCEAMRFEPHAIAVLAATVLNHSRSDENLSQPVDVHPAVSCSWEDDSSVQSGDACASPASLARQASLPSTQSYVYKGAGLSVSTMCFLLQLVSSCHRGSGYACSTGRPRSSSTMGGAMLTFPCQDRVE